jgi:hypothetical protein
VLEQHSLQALKQLCSVDAVVGHTVVRGVSLHALVVERVSGGVRGGEA